MRPGRDVGENEGAKTPEKRPNTSHDPAGARNSIEDLVFESNLVQQPSQEGSS